MLGPSAVRHASGPPGEMRECRRCSSRRRKPPNAVGRSVAGARRRCTVASSTSCCAACLVQCVRGARACAHPRARCRKSGRPPVGWKERGTCAGGLAMQRRGATRLCKLHSTQLASLPPASLTSFPPMHPGAQPASLRRRRVRRRQCRTFSSTSRGVLMISGAIQGSVPLRLVTPLT